MDTEKLRAEINRLSPWAHAIELAPDVLTARVGLGGGNADTDVPQIYDPAVMMRGLVASLYPNGMGGRSFLDCGCNAGGHVFAAKALGAGRCFGFDARQHWIDQANFVAQYLPSDGASFATCKLAELPAMQLGTFDMTLFSGLFYHLPDPVAGLKVAADLTGELIVVNTSSRPGLKKGLTLSLESATHVMSGVDGLAWLPTGPDVVRDILAWCGFPHSRVDMDWRPQHGPRGWRRIQVIGARDASTFADYDRARPDAAHAPKRRVWRRLLRGR